MSNNPILEADARVSKIMKDIRDRVTAVYDRYIGDKKSIPKLPPFEELVRNDRLRYETSVNLTNLVDDLSELRVRVSLVYRHLTMTKMGLSPKAEDIQFVRVFQQNLNTYLDELSNYRYEILDLIKNANSKLRVLESSVFFNE